MQLHRFTRAAFAAAIALQAAPCQVVSMQVMSSVGTVGYAGEPFQCLPNQTLASLGDTLLVSVYGTASLPYVVYTGTPSTYCQPIGGIHGELAVGAPIYTFRVGMLTIVPGYPDTFGADQVKYPIATYLPLGTQLRLQVLSLAPEGLAFSRATEVHIR